MIPSKVKDMAVPLSHCAMVSEDATLHDAVTTMEATKMMFDRWDERPRIILVHDDDSKIIGTIRYSEVLWALEPKYKELGEIRHWSRFGLSRSFAASTFSKYTLWSEPLSDLCRKAADMKVVDIMSPVTEDRFIDEEALLTEAVHLMLTENHSSLIVVRDKEAKGIIRLVDIAGYVFDEIKKFPPASEE